MRMCRLRHAMSRAAAGAPRGARFSAPDAAATNDQRHRPAPLPGSGSRPSATKVCLHICSGSMASAWLSARLRLTAA